MRISPVWGWVAALAAAGAALYATALAGLQATLAEPRLPWWGLAIVFFLAEAFPVHLDFRSETHTLSLSEIGVVLGLFLATPGALVLAIICGAGLALVTVRRQRPLKVAFNVAQFTVSTAAAVLAFRALAGLGDPHGPIGWAAAGVGAATFGVVSVVLVAVTIAIVAGGAPLAELPSAAALGLAVSFASASLAVAAVVMLEADRRSVWLMIVPAAFWAFAFRAYGAQRRRHEHVQFLYRTMRATQSAPEFRAAIRELLVAARTMLSAEYAEILLFDSPDDGALRSVIGPSDEALMEPVTLSEAARAAIVSASEREGATLLPRARQPHALDAYLAERGLGDALVVALQREQRTFGLLIAADRSGEVSTFNTDDRTLFETFAAHAGVLLENDRVKEQLRYQAFHDALTGLPNRILFAERIGAALAERERATVLFLDLDDFKTVNDTFGHSAGDELLAAVAERVRACLRPGNVAARLGGDEFGVLVEQADEHEATEIASRLVDAMRSPFILDGREVSVHASVGIASEASGVRTADELLTHADVAMYSAKAGGKRRYAVYEPRMHARLRGRHELAAALEHAVERGEICVHYQPIVALANGGTVAFEALVRWHHPSRGLLPPRSFLPIAEERGLIPQIGREVLRRACTQSARWQETRVGGDSLSIAVNLSPTELMLPQLAQEVEGALRDARLAPESLILEITESSAMADPAAALAAMQRLRRIGVRLALDDFGTGYSSLGHLRDLPIDTLKIAKPFVDNLGRRSADATFLDGVLRLATTLELDVVAEGIERPEQARLLRELECRLGQGFHYARPAPADEIEAQLASATSRRSRIRVA